MRAIAAISTNTIATCVAGLLAGAALLSVKIETNDILWLALFAAGAWVFYVKQWLTESGSLSAFFTACILYPGGYVMFILPVFLLAGGSLLSKINEDNTEKGGRNAIQVMANGGVAFFCLVWSYYTHTVTLQVLLEQAFMISFGVSICDTFSSEGGKYFKGRTVDIIGFKAMKPGLSGGISWQGSMAGLLALCVIMPLSETLLAEGTGPHPYIIVFGFAGMLADSVFGSVLQAKYKSGKGELTEDHIPYAMPVKGYIWCTNDVVNLMSNSVVTGLYLLINAQ